MCSRPRVAILNKHLNPANLQNTFQQTRAVKKEQCTIFHIFQLSFDFPAILSHKGLNKDYECSSVRNNDFGP